MSGTAGDVDSETQSGVSPSVSTNVPPVTENSSLNFQITPQKLNGKNFLSWSRSAAMVIRGKGKIAFIDGTSSRPTADDPTYAQWDASNSIVMAWLIHSMEDEIGETYLFCSTAKEIWDNLVLAYSDVDNSSQLFELRTRARNLRQDGQSVTQYYSALRKLWQEVDMFHSASWKNPADALLFKQIVQKDRIYDFLAGLTKDLDDVRGRLLGLRPLPSLDEIFAEVRREEHRRRVMLGDGLLSQVESSALAAHRVSSSVAPALAAPRPPTARQKASTNTAWCDHCNKAYHTRDQCWLLHGKPENWVSNRLRKKQGNQQLDTLGTVNFTKAQVDHLCNLLSSKSAAASSPAPASTSNLNTSLMVRQGTLAPSVETMLNPGEQWIVDSGATDHMTGNSKFFLSYTPSSGQQKVQLADGTFSTVAGKGKIRLSQSIFLQDVLHVPKLTYNLISVSKLTNDLSCGANFSKHACVFQDLETGKKIGSARVSHGLYYLAVSSLQNNVSLPMCLSSVSTEKQVMLMHFRLGHPSFSYMKHLFPHLFSNKSLTFQCDICQLAKHTRTFLPPQIYRPSTPFTLIHSDIWGPSRVPTISSQKWFVTFIDDHTRVSWVYVLKDKSDTSPVFKNFYQMVQTQFNTKIRILRTDNGTEYFNSILGEFFNTNGILHQSSCIDTPKQNGVAERKNRHLLEIARALMFSTSVPKHFWGDAVLTACYLINRLPSKILDYKTPLETFSVLFPHYRSFSQLESRIFGCVTFVHDPSPGKSKLDPRSLKCVFLGYSATKKGYRCYCPQKHKYYVSTDVTFFENQPFYTKNLPQGESGSDPNFWEYFQIDNGVLSGVLNPKLSSSLKESTPQPIPTVDRKLLTYSRRKNREKAKDIVPQQSQSSNLNSDPEIHGMETSVAVRKEPRPCTKHPISNFVGYNKLSKRYKTFVTNLTDVEIPKNVGEALKNPEWRAAILEEIRALEKNRTWDVVEKPKDKTIIGCKWVFTVKYKADGTIERYKARLVAKGYTQTYGVDYQETFAPVAKINTVRVLLSLAANLDWPLQQLDVKNAFLNGELEEDVFMDLPPGFNNGGNGRVVKLRKSLYGLKQSPRAWFDRFMKAIKGQGYVQAQTDHTLFYRHKGGKVTILIVYVDDIIITGDDIVEITRVKKGLASEFEMKDLGKLQYFLGMEIARNREGISVSQRKYVLDLLKETGMLGCKPADTPMDPNVKLGSLKESIPVDRGRYQRLVGKLIYLSHTRPDISFAVSYVSQFMHAPTEEHMATVMRVLRYLKGSPGRGLFFKKNTRRGIEAYTDADWAGSITDRRSTSGYCSFVWGNLVTWRSKKQTVVARSSAEAELRSLAHGLCEMMWLKDLLDELRQQADEPLKLYCDNKAAISITHNPVYHDRTKHVGIDRHFIKEKIEKGVVCIIYVPTESQAADVLTKSLWKPDFERLVYKLGLLDIYSQA